MSIEDILVGIEQYVEYHETPFTKYDWYNPGEWKAADFVPRVISQDVASAIMSRLVPVEPIVTPTIREVRRPIIGG